MENDGIILNPKNNDKKPGQRFRPFFFAAAFRPTGVRVIWTQCLPYGGAWTRGPEIQGGWFHLHQISHGIRFARFPVNDGF